MAKTNTRTVRVPVSQMKDARAKLLMRKRGATGYETRAALGKTDGRCTQYSKLAELAVKHGYTLKLVSEDRDGAVRYRFV